MSNTVSSFDSIKFIVLEVVYDVKKILIIGSQGMLGQSLVKILSRNKSISIVTAAFTNADYMFDFSNDEYLIKSVNSIRPDVLINAAAIVGLPQCEADPGMAYVINTRLPGRLAELCDNLRCYLIHISTDHYYCNDCDKKHLEIDKITLKNEYARTKYLGEQLVALYSHSLIVRTNIVGYRNNPSKPTFLEWCIQAFNRDEEMTLFDDFYTSSIYTDQLCMVLEDLLEIRPEGIVNIASSTVSNKMEFILALAKRLTGNEPRYRIGKVNQMLDIPRADSLGLDVNKIENIVGYKMPDLEKVIYDIGLDYKRMGY